MISDEDKIIDKGFERCDGPFVKALDSALASFNVERQAYYSGTFIGNHVHRCLQVCIVPHMYSSMIHNVAFKPRYIDTVCTAVVETAEKLAPSLVSTAETSAGSLPSCLAYLLSVTTLTMEEASCLTRRLTN